MTMEFGAGFSMMAGKDLARAFSALLVVVIAVFLGPLAATGVAAPTLTIETPTSGTLTQDRTPLIGGSTSDNLDTILVKIYAGAGTGGSVVQEPTNPLPLLGWSVTPSALED